MKVIPAITLIQDTVQGVRVGDPIFGDPTTPMRTLEGKYLHNDPDEPLSIIILDEAAETACVVARVRVHNGQLRVSRLGERDEIPVRAGGPYADEVDRTLREAVRGIRLAKELRRKERASWRTGRDDNYVLAQHKLTLMPVVDDI